MARTTICCPRPPLTDGAEAPSRTAFWVLSIAGEYRITETLVQAVDHLLQHGKQILAVKLVRSHTDCSLATAKDFVDFLQDVANRRTTNYALEARTYTCGELVDEDLADPFEAAAKLVTRRAVAVESNPQDSVYPTPAGQCFFGQAIAEPAQERPPVSQIGD